MEMPVKIANTDHLWLTFYSLFTDPFLEIQSKNILIFKDV